MKTTAFYKTCLQQELARRCSRNPRYSIRAFAKLLEIDSGALSRILAGSRPLSFKMAQRMLDTLELAPKERERFLNSLAEHHRSRGLQRIAPALRALESRPEQPRELSIDLFKVIADWHHYAILELTYVEGFKPEPAWIASELGISLAETRLAIDRLLNLGLLADESGTLRKSEGQITTGNKHLTTAAHKRHQKQVLEGALRSLQDDPIADRSQTSMTMAIDPDLLPEAKRRIEAFTQELCQFLESQSRKRVYEMGICLYPVQKNQPKKPSFERKSPS